MAEAEMYLLENAIKELRSRGHDSHDRQGPHLSPGSSTAEAGPSGFKSTVVAPSSQAQPVSSNDPSRPHPSSPVQSVSDSID
ncbi:hypothetical protein PAXINDRAFT_17618 [Paxillus involutus ATCC 200175]|uniref:Uncharacterized protein n=1 Tax=Paxillus involutus ATCC 200175 TaxID=664439 RepID=A0A0C9TN76_PAXIN|nr:hypothetical protein PAXINDRAFT_17618 [Paxillus involutus ATCC 200175]